MEWSLLREQPSGNLRVTRGVALVPLVAERVLLAQGFDSDNDVAHSANTETLKN